MANDLDGANDTEEFDGAAQPGGRRKRSLLWRIVKWAFVFCLVGSLVAVGLLIYAWNRIEVPTPEQIRRSQPKIATIYAQDSNIDAVNPPDVEVGRIVPPAGNRTEVKLADVPEHVRSAVIAAEDRDFYTNSGYDLTGIARAAWGQVRGDDSAGGGSTITQQYIKNAIVGDEYSYSRKAREIMMAAKMSRQWSKDQILEAYLNTIYFGRGAYGIDQAAHAYFGRPVSEVSVEEGAVLAAVIQSPGRLDPEVDLAAATVRWNYVLDGMVEIGKLDRGVRGAAQYPVVRSSADQPSENQMTGSMGLVKRQVVDELRANGITDEEINTRGLQIYTTVDLRVMEAARAAAEDLLVGEQPYVRTAVVSVDPRTGGVKGYYGGNNEVGWDYANAPLMTGSSFKTFGLAAALDQGISLAAQYSSAPYQSGGIVVENSEGDSCGVCSVAEATKRSLNTSFMRIMADLENGPQDVADMAHRVGIPQQIPGLADASLTEAGGTPNNGIILGQYPVRPLDMAAAYATFATSGIKHDAHFVSRVVADNGEVLLDNTQNQGERAISAAVADNVTSALQPVAAYSNGHSLAGGRPSAAKTGTVQLGETGQNRDAWMVGYTPSLSTAVWVGSDQGEPLVNSWGGRMYGSGLPSDIWKQTMDTALANSDFESFPYPESIAGQAGAPVYVPPAGPAETTSEAPPSSAAPAPSQPAAPTAPQPETSLTRPTIPGLPGIENPLAPLEPVDTPAPPVVEQPVVTPPAAETSAAEAPNATATGGP